MMEMDGVTLKLVQIGNQLTLLSGVTQMVMDMVTTQSGTSPDSCPDETG